VVVAAAVGVAVVLLIALSVGAGVPLTRLAARIAALGTVGTLLFAAVLRPPSQSPAARQALRAASVWATGWAAATAIHALLTLVQLVGASVTGSAFTTFVADLAAGRAAVVVLVAAMLVALLARRCTTSLGAGALLTLSVAALVVPAVLTGHSATADHHVLAATNLSVHVVAASVWVGGLLALLMHGRGRDDLAPAAQRYSAVALACFLGTGFSGLLAAWLVLGETTSGVSGALGTGYGWLLLAKTAALVALGAFGWQHRRRTLPRLRAGRPRSFRRFALVEVGVMLATVALAVALSASPPPAAAGAPPAADTPAATAPTTTRPADPMAGHDHGELSVAVLIDASRLHVAGPVEVGSRVTVHNASETEVTITAEDGSFDVVVPPHALITFAAPDEPGSYPFASRHSPSFADVLEVG
jgi:putative copper resistance protein D